MVGDLPLVQEAWHTDQRVEIARAMPLTAHGHSRPVTHLHFSHLVDDNESYLISACKDNNPMLRDGVTGDWIGTFLGHKGAVWSSRLSTDGALAATGSADFTARVWDPQTGECLHVLNHNHIVKSVAFPVQRKPQFLATGGLEKKLRIFDLSTGSVASTVGDGEPRSPSTNLAGMEIGSGVHTGSIKSVVWNVDYNIITTAAEDKTIRWWDLRAQQMIRSFTTDRDIMSCELSTNMPGDSGDVVLSAATGNTCYFFDGHRPGELLKSINFGHEVASVAINPSARRFVTGGHKDFWIRIYDYDSERELDVQKGHHGPVWTMAYAPDGKVLASGSEDGTVKLWKHCQGPHGLWP